MFITTANSLSGTPRPLLDRMEVIQIPGYTLAEKLEIAMRYRVPRQIRDHGMAGRGDFRPEAIERIVTEYTREAGVRNLDRQIAKAIRKSAREYLDEPWKQERLLDADDIRKLLGVPPYRDEKADSDAQVGLTHALAWTS